MSAPAVVHLVGSLGGHLELLTALTPVLDELGLGRVWVTSEGARAESLRRTGETVRTLPRLDRSTLRGAAVAAGARLALRERPRLVLTSGAGLAIAFALTARARGARLVFLETMARVTGGSATGRLLSRAASDVFVQWPELLATYPRATVCRPLLLDGVGRVGGDHGRGTFVTLGSHDEPFRRLLEAVVRAAHDGTLPGPVTVQAGESGVGWSGIPGLTVLDYVSPEEFRSHVEGSRLVITHGGAGAVSTALRAGRRPIVMARLRRYGEHVDDHQLHLVDKLGRLGLIVPVGRSVTSADVAATAELTQAPKELTRLPSLLDEARALLAASALH